MRNISIISKFQVDDFNFIAYYCDLNCLLLLYKRWEISDLYKKISLINLKKYLMIFNYFEFENRVKEWYKIIKSRIWRDFIK